MAAPGSPRSTGCSPRARPRAVTGWNGPSGSASCSPRPAWTRWRPPGTSPHAVVRSRPPEMRPNGTSRTRTTGSPTPGTRPRGSRRRRPGSTPSWSACASTRIISPSSSWTCGPGCAGNCGWTRRRCRTPGSSSRSVPAKRTGRARPNACCAVSACPSWSPSTTTPRCRSGSTAGTCGRGWSTTGSQTRRGRHGARRPAGHPARWPRSWTSGSTRSPRGWSASWPGGPTSSASRPWPSSGVRPRRSPRPGSSRGSAAGTRRTTGTASMTAASTSSAGPTSASSRPCSGRPRRWRLSCLRSLKSRPFIPGRATPRSSAARCWPAWR